MDDELNLKALVVYESFFGNTESIARAIADGLRFEGLSAEALDVADTQGRDPGDHDLLVVGGPTHGFALSRPSTRDDAVERGGDTNYSRGGLREWLSDLPSRKGLRLAAAFDTRAGKVRNFPMSAARSAAKLLRRRGFTLVVPPAGFVVEDTKGPLEEGEVERATTWARSVAGEAKARIEADGKRRSS